MPFESQSGIGLRHPTTIIHDLNRGASRIDYHHADVLRASIYSILHQFLYHRSWTLNDLTSSNLIGHGIWKKLYQIRHSCLLVYFE